MTSVDKYRSMYFSALMDYPFDFPVAHNYVRTTSLDSMGNDVGISIQCDMPPGETIYGVISYLSQTNLRWDLTLSMSGARGRRDALPCP